MAIEPLARKVLLIGWDAADWKVIDPLLDAGQMPNLERIVNAGVIGNIATLYPVLSPMLWTSIATGKRPYKHGIWGFSEPDPQTGLIRPITNLSRKTKAIWNILNQHGKQSNVVGWWPSHPAEPLSGVMVSNHYHRAPPDIKEGWPMQPGTVHPQRLIEPLSQLRIHPWELGAEHLLPLVPNAANIDQEKDKRLLTLAKVVSECSTIHAAATAVMQNEPWDFMAVYYDAIDHFSHAFMRYHPPRQKWVSEEDFEMYKDVVSGGYRYHDMMLGALLALAGDDTTVILISDHGFHPDHLRPQHLPNEPAGPAAEHRPYGIFAMKGPGVRKDERVYGATLLDVTPTILRLFGLPVGRDMDGKVLAAAFESPPAVEAIDSWDAVPGDSGQHPPNMQLDAAEARESIKHLVDLGYIEEPDADQEKAVAQTVRELHYNLARSYMDGNRHGEAARLLAELWEKWPDEQRFGIKLLDCYLAMQRYADARATINLVKDRKRQYVRESREQLKQLRDEVKAKDPKEITPKQRHELRRLRMRAATNRPALAYLTAIVLHGEGKYKQALAQLDKAERIQVHNRPSVFQKRGEIYLDMKRWEDAEKCFHKVLQIDPVNAQAHLGLCHSYLARRLNRRAAEEARAAVGLLYHNPKGHYLHGVALHRLGQVDVAVKALEMAIAQNPVFPQAHKRLAWLCDKRLHDPERAERHRRLMEEARQAIRNHRQGELPAVQEGVGTAFRLETPTTDQTSLWKNRPDPAVESPATNRCAGIGPEELITVVSGLPRSGTSMMMQMLAAGGMPMLADEIRGADDSNPRGYYEFEKVKSLMRDQSWLADARGKAVKVVAQLVPHLSSQHHYKIIFMDRDIAEVIASQRTMLDRLGRAGANTSDERLAGTYAKQVEQVKKLVTNHARAEMITVGHRETIDDPTSVAVRVAGFLNRDLDVPAMVRAVDPKLYRHRTAANAPAE